MPSQMISNCDASISKIWENMSMYSICILPVFFQTKPHGSYAHRMLDSSPNIYIYIYIFIYLLFDDKMFTYIHIYMHVYTYLALSTKIA